MLYRIALTGVLILSAVVLGEAQEQDFSAELPRIAPTPAEKAIDTFQVKEGYRIELAAAEPLVASPVAICWDEGGRMYVVEMRGYSEHRDEKLSRVRRLHDDNNDGVYDRATNFAEGLLWPTAIACWDGGVFVGDAPDILYLKDTDDDGIADVKKRVFTGFGTQNVQGLLNTFLWGLDNRIHGSASSVGGQISVVEKPDVKPINVNGRDFSFDPRTLDFRAESGGAQHGMSFDDFGHKFVCSNSDHCQQVMYEDRYVARNPLLAAPGARVSIAADGPQAEVFRISPVEPWRIVRTRLRVSGAVPGIVEGGGRAAGYFTGATGITMVRGSAFANDPMYGMVVVGDVGSNLIHRKKLTLNGLQYSAERVDKESEFVASKDNWFRPAQFANGPDGALYVIDVYREVIEHPASLPPVIKKHLDLDSGRDRGRIWRIAPQKWERPRFVSLDKTEPRELVGLLEHKNAWQRETASRLLVERKEAAAPDLAELAVSKGASPRARVHALYGLAAQGTLTKAEIVAGLDADDPRLREHAIRLAEPLLAGEKRPWDEISPLVDDKDQRVQYQLAFSLGVNEEANLPLLTKFMLRHPHDRWMKAATLSSLQTQTPALLINLAAYDNDAEAAAALEAVADHASRLPPADLVKAVNALVESGSNPRLLLVLERRQRTRGGSLQSVLPKELWEGLGKILSAAQSKAIGTIANKERPVAERIAALDYLLIGEAGDIEPTLQTCLTPQSPRELQIAALRTCAELKDDQVGGLLVSSFAGFSPEVRRVALDVLVQRPERAQRLLMAIRTGEIAPTDIDASHIELIKKHADKGVARVANELFENTARRADVVEQYRPVLEKPGDLTRGKVFFAKKCAACHKVEGVGHELGPNLAAMKNRGAEAILLNVLDPNREVNPQYLSYVAVTTEGRTLSGVIAAESANSITLKRADNQQDEILRSDIEELRSTGLSLMPEGLEKEIDPQTMADLIAYLLSLK